MGRKSLIRPFNIINQFPLSVSFTSDAILREYPTPPNYLTSYGMLPEQEKLVGKTNIENVDVIGMIVEWFAPTYFNADYYDEVGTTAALSTLIGSPYAPDGTNLTNGQTVLCDSLTVVANRGVYRATVVATNVTAWTRVKYGQDQVNGVPVLNDNVYIVSGTANTDYTYFCDNATLGTWTARISSSPVGTLSVQVQSGTSSWTTLPLFNPLSRSYVLSIAITGVSGIANIDLTNLSYENMRLVYEYTSGGSCSMTTTLTAKVVGA